MISLILLVFIAYAAADSAEKCSVGEWGAWSECIPSRLCNNSPDIEIEARNGGIMRMEDNMKIKTRLWSETENCKKSMTCLEQLMKPMSGFHQCTEEGVAGSIPCRNVDQLSFLTFEQMVYSEKIPADIIIGNDIWGWTDITGDEYAIMGLAGGTAFVRITDPKNPVPVGFLPTATFASEWRDIKVIGRYAFIVSEANFHGLQVFDLTRLRGRTTIINFAPDATNSDFGHAHNIVENVNTDYIYVIGAINDAFMYPNNCFGGLLVFNVSDPLNPTYAGCYLDDGYIHDAQCVTYHGPDLRYVGRELCFCYAYSVFTIVDVTNKNNMKRISSSRYPNSGYIHQGWLSENQKIVLIDDEWDELPKYSITENTKTYIFDVTDLENPQLKNVHISSQTAIDHNQYIRGNFTFQANYESGLRILHIDQSTYTLSQVGYFDVFPSRTTANFAGVWSVYPFFPSGNIALSSIDYGLFIVRPQWSNIEQLVKSKTTYAEQTRSRPLLSVEPGAVCPHLQESKICTAPISC